MNYRKVYGGAPVGDGSLCDSCFHVQIVKGHSKMERITICGYAYPPIFVPFRVTECNAYDDKRLPEIEEMEKIALDLTVDKPARPAGFKIKPAGSNGSHEPAIADEKDVA